MKLDEMAKNKLLKRLDEVKQITDSALNAWIPSENEMPSVLHEAMRYVVFNGGKRVRPFLVLECCRAVGGLEEKALPAACAVEVLHTYSLVHDDLPCMDNDDFRRGKPTCHKVYGESIAVLCGDALLTFAFDLLSTKLLEVGVSAEIALLTVATLAEAGGSRWLIGGQTLDIITQAKAEDKFNDKLVSAIHERKTSALMQASCVIGGLIGGADNEQLEALKNYGKHLGMAFQITDDLLDIICDVNFPGKSIGKDKQQKKLTYPEVFGLEASKKLAEEEIQNAISSLTPLENQAELLCLLAQFLTERKT